jgi:hypothetical protein
MAMSQSSEVAVTRGGLRRLLITAALQTAVVLLTAVGLMYALRGKPADQQIRDRWARGGSVSGGPFGQEPPPPPIQAEWPSEEAMLAAAPATPLVEKTFKYEDLDFTISVPEEATIEIDRPADITVKFPKQVVLNFRFGRTDLEAHRRRPSVFASAKSKPIPFMNDHILLIEHDEAIAERYMFFANVTHGYFDFFVTPDRTDNDYKTSNTKEECLLLLKCMRTLKLTTSLPTDRVKFFEAIAASVETRDDGEIIGLDFVAEKIGPTLLAKVGECSALEKLLFYSHYVPSASFAVFEKWPNLKTLSVGGGRSLNDEELEHISKCRKLESLSGSLNSDSVTGLAKIGELARLKQLQLDGLGDKNIAGLGELGRLADLEELELDGWAGAPPTEALSFVSKLGKLRTLKIGLPIDDDTAAAIAGPTELETLAVEGANVSDAGFKHLTGFPKLRSLAIEGRDAGSSAGPMTVTAAGLKTLKNLPDLESLHLENAPIDDAGIEVIAALPKLTSLELEKTNATDAALTKLAQCRQLKKLSVYKCEKITPEAAEAFRKARPDVSFIH